MIINCLSLIGLGMGIGVFSGLFGVGGGFLLVPMLNVLFNIPYNIAVGSSLCQMIGTSTAATLKHRGYGHIDYKLAASVLLGAVVGTELGARLLMWLKGLGTVVVHTSSISKMYLWVNIVYMILLCFVGISMFLESRKARKRPPRGGVVETRFSQRIQKIKIPPIISLPISKIDSIPLWSLIGLGFVVGMFSGLLGIGGGFVMGPSLIYLFGVPTSMAVGTSLFQMIFTSGYGSLTHFFKGNIDFRLVAYILSGSLVGSQLGSMLNKKLRGAHIRYYFSWVIFIAIGIILVKFLLVTGYLGS